VNGEELRHLGVSDWFFRRTKQIVQPLLWPTDRGKARELVLKPNFHSTAGLLKKCFAVLDEPTRNPAASR